MITYGTNWMGPISNEWYRRRGLLTTEKKLVTASLARFLKDYDEGEYWEREQIVTHYSGGRIDIRGLPEEEYWNGWHEYSLPTMHGEDWNNLSNFLSGFKSKKLVSFEELIEEFERHNGKKIRWASELSVET